MIYTDKKYISELGGRRNEMLTQERLADVNVREKIQIFQKLLKKYLKSS